jgi:1-acyl-sn-glycerol-3-phosphate acyltransferase
MIRKILKIIYFPYQWLIYMPLMAILTTFFVFIGVLMIIFINDKIANKIAGVWWARSISWLVPMIVKVKGRENIKKKQSYVVVANHISAFDVLLLFGWLGIDLKWVIKKELRKVPVFGYACEKGGNILIDRSNHERAVKSLQMAKEKVVGGTSIIILPEGTRSKDGRTGEFKRGAFITAFDLDVPVLPVSISGTDRIQPSKTMRLFPGIARMTIHPPIELSDYSRETIDDLIGDTRNTIINGLDNMKQ